MRLKGIAHINFTVRDFDGVLPFYKELFAFLGLKEMIVGDGYYYCVGRIGVGIQRCEPDHADTHFHQGRAGLHHYCLAMDSRKAVDELAQFVREHGLNLVREPAENDDWFPGMYSLLFEDPEGLRIEANHITRKTA